MRYATLLAVVPLFGAAFIAFADEHGDQSGEMELAEVSKTSEPDGVEGEPSAPPKLCEMDVNAPMSGFTAIDELALIDAPDAEPVRATAPIEHWLVGRLSRAEIPPPLTKTFCQIGITDMVTDYHHPVANDDAVIGVAYRAIYSWNADAEFPGWQLTLLGERFDCARGIDTETKLCR